MISKQEKVQKIKQWFLKTKLDANVVNETIKVQATNVSPQVMLATSAKLIKLNKGEEEPDDRDNLKYSNFLGLEDVLKERIEKDAGRLQQKAKMKIKQKKNLSWLHSGFFTPQIKFGVVGNSLSQAVDEGNPVNLLDIATKVTKLGEGGVASTDSIPDSARQINSSYTGLYDFFRVSEDLAVGVTHRFTLNTKKGNDGKIYKLLLDKNKKPVWVSHEEMLRSKVELPEE